MPQITTEFNRREIVVHQSYRKTGQSYRGEQDTKDGKQEIYFV